MIKLFHGKNYYLSHRNAIRAYKQLVILYPNYESIEIDAYGIDSSQVTQSYQTHGMFSTGKIILIKRLYNNKQKADIIEDIISTFEHSGDELHLVIWEEQKIPSNTRYLKFISKSYEVDEPQPLNKRTFITWARNECSEVNILIDQNAINELSERCNYEPERFINEINKLRLLYRDSISIEDVKTISTDTYEHDIWSLMDGINAGKHSKVAEIMTNLLKQRVDPHYILSMIFRNTRILVQVKSLAVAGAGPKEIASILRLPPFTVPSLIRSASDTDLLSIRKLYKKLANLDHQIKTGQIDAELGVSLLTTIL